jgi:hypothetical protein
MRKQLAATLLLACSTHKAPPTPEPIVEPVVSRCEAPSALKALPIHGSSSALALATMGAARVAVLADEDDAMVRIVDLASQKELAHASLPAAPGHVLATATVACASRSRRSMRCSR